jgi:hypothetical protein
VEGDRVPLPAWNAADVLELVRAARPEAEDLAEQLHDASAGNAFVLTRMLREPELGEAIRYRLSHRLANLDADTAAVVNAAAIIEDHSERQVLADACGLPTERFVAAKA